MTHDLNDAELALEKVRNLKARYVGHDAEVVALCDQIEVIIFLAQEARELSLVNQNGETVKVKL